MHQCIFWAHQPPSVLPALPMPAVEQAAPPQTVKLECEAAQALKTADCASTALPDGPQNLQGRSQRLRKSPKHLSECFVFDNPTSPPVHGTEAETTDPSSGDTTNQDRC